MRWDGLKVFSGHQPGVLQLDELAGQRSVGDVSQVALKLVEPRRSLHQPINDLQLPLARNCANQRLNPAVLVGFGRCFISIQNDRTCRFDRTFLTKINITEMQ